MSLFLPPNTTSYTAEWARKVVVAINALLRGNVFPTSDTAPPEPQPGQGWFDTSVNKAKVWDGTIWQTLW